MRKIFDITSKDIQQMLRDWKFLFFLLIMPAGFTLLFGFIFGGMGSADVDTRLLVAVIDEDQSYISTILLNTLGQSGVIRLELRESSEGLDEGVQDGDLSAALVIPASYMEALLAGESEALLVTIDPQSSSGITAQQEIQALTNRVLAAVQTAQFSLTVYQRIEGITNAIDTQAIFDYGLESALQAWQNPPITLDIQDAVIVRDDPATEAFGDNPYSHSSPGMMAQFAIAGLISAAAILVTERKTRAMARMLTTTTTRVEILAGHFLTMFLMIFAQFVVLVVFGQIVLKLNYFDQPFATLLMIVATALFAASLGLLIATVAKTEEHVIVLTLIPMFILSGLGGAWLALELTPPTVQMIGHFTPVAWIMDGFKGILIRGWGLSDVLKPVGFLLLFTAGCMGISIWKFKFE